MHATRQVTSARRDGAAITGHLQRSRILGSLLGLALVAMAPGVEARQCTDELCEPRDFLNPWSLGGDYFGRSIAIDVNVAVVGAPGATYQPGGEGRAYVFVRGADDEWHAAAELLNPSPDVFGEFGHSVAIRGDTILVGDPGSDEDGASAGAAFVFVKPSTGWSLPDTDADGIPNGAILPSAILRVSSVIGPIGGQQDNTSFQAGRTVALGADGQTAYVGVPRWNDNHSFFARRGEGRVMVYERPVAGWGDPNAPVTLTETVQLIRAENEDGPSGPTDPPSNFASGFTSLGSSLAVWTNPSDNLDRVFVGGTSNASANDGTAPGVWVFDEPSVGWGLAATPAVDPLDPDWPFLPAVLGGIVYWTWAAVPFHTAPRAIVGSDTTQVHQFGASVASFGPSVAAVGSLQTGGVYLFAEAASGAPWTETDFLASCDGVATMGTSVAFSQDGTLYAGEPGSVYRLTRDDQGTPQTSDDVWSHASRTSPKMSLKDLVSPVDSTPGKRRDNFGYALAIDGNRCIVGAPTGYPGGQTNRGVAFELAEKCECTPYSSLITNWWTFDGTYDDLIGDQDGTPIGSPNVTATTIVEQGANFSGGASIDLGPVAGNFGTSDFTVEFWLFAWPIGSNANGTNFLAKHDGTAGWHIDNFPFGNKLNFTIEGVEGAVTMGVDGFTLGLNHSEWAHIALTRRAISGTDGVYEMYWNGARVAQATGALVDVSNTAPLMVGSPSHYGWMDEISLYAGSLSPVEIRDIAFAFGNGKCKVTDVDPPVVAIDDPQEGDVFGTTSVSVDASLSDVSPSSVTSSPAGLSASLPAGGGTASGVVPLANEGDNLITVTATDDLGNVGGSSVTVVRDTTDPVIDVLSPGEGAVLGTTPTNFSAHVTDLTATTLTFDGNSVSLADGGGMATGDVNLVSGPNAVTFTATDEAGNVASTVRNVTLDLDAPLVSIDTPADGACFGPGDSPVAVIATVSDLTATSVGSTPSGVAASLPAGGGTATGSVSLVEGSNTISVSATDAAAGFSTDSIVVVLDTTAPAVTLVSPTDSAAVRGTIDFDVDATDQAPGSGVALVELMVDGSVVQTFSVASVESSLDTTALLDGFHTLSARATDGKGNATTGMVGVLVDNTPPSLSIDAPGDGALVGGTIAFDATGTDSGSGLVLLDMLAAGQMPSPQDGSTVFTPVVSTGNGASLVDTTQFPDGTLVLTVAGQDEVGNTTSTSITVEVDNQAPDKSLISPTDGEVVAGTVNIVADAQDPNLASLEIRVDGVSVASSTTSPLSVAYDTTIHGEGPMVITVVALDTLGNTATCSATVTVDNVASVDCDLHPETLNLKSKGKKKSVTLETEGSNLSLLMPTEDHAWELRVPGGSPVPSTAGFAGDDVLNDEDGDGIGELTVKFDRQLLIGSIEAGITAGLIERDSVITVEIWADGAKLCEDVLRIIH